MCDLETMDNTATAAIVSIGAVECNLITGEIGKTFYRVIDLTDQKGTINAETLYWWMGQSDSARKALLVPGKISIIEMCNSFTRWINYLTAANDSIRLWGNGASFDNSILRQTFRFYKKEFPIKYWND
ncbi:MAG TPA: 3'-5' exonuclease, partial [Thermodesulfobacteriota bacterium]|nr:3'-5' exonuclease [Thermodesulfobacteriota bacterium]